MTHDSEMNACSKLIAIALSLAAFIFSTGASLAQEIERPARMKELPKRFRRLCGNRAEGRSCSAFR